MASSYNVKVVVRKPSLVLPLAVKQIVVDDLVILASSNVAGLLKKELSDVDVLVHATARMHMIHDEPGDPLEVYRSVNRDATLEMALIASAAGVKRFIFISPLKLMGKHLHSKSHVKQTIKIYPSSIRSV